MSRTITVECFGKPASDSKRIPITPPDRDFTGKNREAALENLRKALKAASDDEINEVQITVAYKEYRRIFLDEEDNKWKIDISENGCGEYREYGSRAKAIDAFMFMCSEKGEHWD